jgi:hypothetical protein
VTGKSAKPKRSPEPWTDRGIRGEEAFNKGTESISMPPPTGAASTSEGEAGESTPDYED